MRYRMASNRELESQRFTTEDELREALSCRGWELARRLAEEPDDDGWDAITPAPAPAPTLVQSARAERV